MSARKLAVQLLNRTEQEQSYSNLLLDSALSQSQLDDRDKRLCASLYYGVIERRITLDAVISHYSKQPLRKLDCTVRNILRLGIYQLLYCDQIPSRAAVNESVKLTKTCRESQRIRLCERCAARLSPGRVQSAVSQGEKGGNGSGICGTAVAAGKAAGCLWRRDDPCISGGRFAAGKPVYPAESGGVYRCRTGTGIGRCRQSHKSARRI